jgi:glycosyltransferase involved in cell wall biosynthesis
MILHFSISKSGMPHGVSTVVDMLSQCLPDSDHQFFRAKDKVRSNKNPEVNNTAVSSNQGYLNYIKKIDFIYVFFMLISSYKIVSSTRKSIMEEDICLAHDVFCLFWLGIFRYLRVIKKCKLSLYNHSDGHPIETLKQKYKNIALMPLFVLIEGVINNLNIFTIYSLSDSASSKVKHILNQPKYTRFIVVLNYVKGVEISLSEWENKKQNIWLIGTVCERKGQISFFESIENLMKDKNYKLTFNILGPCSEKDQEKLSSFNFVSYLGVHSNVRKLLLPRDICLSVSSNEGLPMSLLEAASKACVIISTDVGGCSEICKDDVNGYLLPYPYISGEILHKIMQLIKDDDKHTELSQNSLKIFNDRFSEKSAIDFWGKESAHF